MHPDYVRVDMPTRYSQADAEWIQGQLLRLPHAMRQKAILSYSAVFEAAFDAEPASFRQENAGRHEANTRLRVFVERHYRAAMGLTEKATLTSTHAPVGAVVEIPEEQAAEEWW